MGLLDNAPPGTFQCGWCGAITPATEVFHEFAPSPRGPASTSWEVYACAACGRFSLDVYGWGLLPAPDRPPIDLRGVPESAKTDYLEAVVCLQAKAPRAAATMVRRAVQTICLDREASRNKKLDRQIEELKERGELTKRLATVATRLRWLGNDGAHPSADGLEAVGPDEAARGVRFLEHLIEHVYVIDAEEEAAEEAARLRREQRAADPADVPPSESRVTGLGESRRR